jgi:hypothetical protein
MAAFDKSSGQIPIMQVILGDPQKSFFGACWAYRFELIVSLSLHEMLRGM